MSLSDEEIKVHAKYNVGDKLYFIQDGTVSIDYVRAVFKNKWGAIYYYFGQWDDEISTMYKVYEESVFKTKQALLKSL